MLVLPGFGFAGDFELPEPITLSNGYESWVIEVQYQASVGKLVFTYQRDGLQYSRLVPSKTYSDLAPVAILVNDAPLLIWSATENESSDSDIYFSRWNQGVWSNPERVHPENNDHDMLPALSINLEGEVSVSWWQNTGEQIVERTAIYVDGHFKTQYSRIAVSAAQRTQSTGFYTGMTMRNSDDPLICIAYGDSITQGKKRNASGHEWGVTQPVNGAQYGGYTEELKAKLTPDIDVVKIYNQGYHGENSLGGALRVDNVIAQHSDANCILIMYGANDPYQGIGPSSTKANVKIMAEYARNHAVVPIIATITPNTSGSINTSIGSYNSKIRAYVEETATQAEDRISLADQGVVMNTNWNAYHSGDGLHLNDTGYEVMATEWNRALRTNPVLFPGPVVIAPIIYLLLGM